MRMNNILERGPGENGKLTVLRRDECHGVSLVMHKLRGREVAGAAQVSCGAKHCCALLAAGSVTCWGASASGQIGSATGAGPTTVPNLP